MTDANGLEVARDVDTIHNAIRGFPGHGGVFPLRTSTAKTPLISPR